MELLLALTEQEPASLTIKAPTTPITGENSICQDIYHAPWRHGVPSFQQGGQRGHKAKPYRVRHCRGSQLQRAWQAAQLYLLRPASSRGFTKLAFC